MTGVRCAGGWRRLVAPGVLLWVAMATGDALAEEKPAPLQRLLEELKLTREALELNAKADKLYQEGKGPEAVPLMEKALGVYQRLYPEDRYPQGHPDLAVSLNNLGMLLQNLGEYARALPYLEKALAMNQRLYPEVRFPSGHPDLANSLNNLATLLQDRGELANAQPYFEKALAMNQRLYPEDRYPKGHPDLAQSLNNLGGLLQARGELARAQPYYEKVLAMYQRLYPEERFPQGHSDLATSLANLGTLLQDRGEYAKAQPYLEKALAMRERLYPSDRFPKGHPRLANSLNNLGALLQARREYARAQPYFEKALAMRQRLYPEERFPQGHPELAASLNNLGSLLQDGGGLAGAQTYYEKALAMRQRLYPEERFPQGHPHLATSLANLGTLLQDRGEYAKAQPHLEKALAMRQRLYPEERFPQGHPDLAQSLNNLAFLLKARGELVKAQIYSEKALTMFQRLYPEERFPQGHPDLAQSLNNLAFLLQARGELARAQTSFEKAVAMFQRLTEAFADLASEAETLNNLAFLPDRDAYLSLISRLPDTDPARVYPLVWRTKGALLRALAHRRLLLNQATDPASRELLEGWQEARRELARLTLSPAPADPAAGQARQSLLEDRTRQKEKLERQLAALIPEFRRQAVQAPPQPEALRDGLPADAAFLDLFRYRAYDAKEQKWGDFHYAAFVLRHGRPVCQVELGAAEPIEAALQRWRQALAAQGRSADAPPSVRAAEAARAAADLRRLVWQPLAPHIGRARRVWICPDGPLAALPFAALPGEKSGTILLEDYTFAIVPHGPALLDWLQEPGKERSGGRLLVLGGVEYGAPGKPWKELAASGRERDDVAGLARDIKSGLEVTSLGGTDADAERVQRGLREARWAHLATHGFFAAEESKERDKLYERSDFLRMQWGERTGAVARNPLTLSGLVLAGANKGGGAGMLTAEALAGEDLRGLELAVLSACQTGLGEADTAEGVFGLQRALHLAGARDVVATLWRVDDEATAALMAVFYRKMWGHEKLPPAEALRQAQLALYRNPGAVKALAGTRGPDFDKEYERAAPPAKVSEERPAPKEGQRLPAKFWAGFVLSGPGR